MGSLDRRLERLEQRAFPEHADCLYRDAEQMEAYIFALEDRGWPVEEQIDAVIASWRIHRLGGTKQLATDRQIYIARVLAEVDRLPPHALDYFRRMAPEQQAEREAWLYGRREWAKADREAHRAWDEWAELHGRYPMPQHILERFRELQRYGA
jgi:hypothetical protein